METGEGKLLFLADAAREHMLEFADNLRSHEYRHASMGARPTSAISKSLKALKTQASKLQLSMTWTNSSVLFEMSASISPGASSTSSVDVLESIQASCHTRSVADEVWCGFGDSIPHTDCKSMLAAEGCQDQL